MPSSWANLPNEILKQVFSYIDGCHLRLHYVCRAWRPTAQERLYSDIHVLANGHVREQLLARTLGDLNCQARHYVKNLTIDKYGETIDKNYALLTSICSICPNITSISIGAPSQQFYQLIYRLRESDHLQKIQRITEPWPKEYIADYCKAILLMKFSATEIFIYSDPTITSVPESSLVLEAFPVAKHLEEFPCLEKVVITTSAYMALPQFDKILDMCPKNKLKVVHLKLQNVEVDQQRRHSSAAKQINAKPQRVLSSVKELELENDALLTDQDLMYIMEKFPSLESLKATLYESGYFSDDENYSFIRSIQSMDTALRFIRYLWRIPCCDFGGFRIAPETMVEAILQTSKRVSINSMEIKSTHPHEPQFTSLGVVKWTTERQKMRRACFCIPPHMEALYQQALETFSSQVEELYLTGSAEYSDRGVNMDDLDEEEIAESRAIVSALEYALSNFSSLKELHLSAATLPTELFNNESTKKLRLDSLRIAYCSMDISTMNALSEILEYVEDLILERNSREYQWCFAEEMYMPQTAFGTIVLIHEYEFHYIVKMSTNARTVYIDFKHGDFMDEPERLTEEQYNSLKGQLDSDVYCTEINCAKWSTIDFSGIVFNNDE
ncbi:hypothetical protein V8B55DRAFT_1493690 [Mucor lusitanicus]|uniref:F-box domain-containing protein n=2 Tax=Mucor circinelloides f. lusitanicus TaxID=29924 RepID=A0A168MGD2_MUCCL|nr:hypothetical protein FB192DRAFT_1361584 [Mucor lusitanicus]OAD04896.1 hypothetical protein MUCCIDRAFT_161606 [Mucor lusitanicus CBS 277.49]